MAINASGPGATSFLRLALGALVLLAYLVAADIAQAQPRYEGRTFSEWQADLKDLSAKVRHQAVRALAHFGPRAAPVLVPMLGDADPQVRQEAVMALGKLGPEARAAVPTLRVLVIDTDEELRVRASHALLRIEPAMVVPALIQGLRAPSAVVRAAAAGALADIAVLAKGKSPRFFLFQQIVLIERPTPTQVQRMAEALERNAISALADTLRDADEDVWKLAVQALREIGVAAVPALLSVQNRLSEWEEMWENGGRRASKHHLERMNAVTSLLAATGRGGVLSTLRACQKSPGALFHQQFMWFSADDAVPLLLDILKTGDDSAKVCTALGLDVFLFDRDWKARPEVRLALESLLNVDKRQRTAWAAAIALTSGWATAAVNEKMTEAAAAATVPLIPALADALANGPRYLQELAAHGLLSVVRIDRGSATDGFRQAARTIVPAVIGGLKHPEASLRLMSLVILKELPESSFEANDVGRHLNRLKTDPDERVRRIAGDLQERLRK